MLFFQIYGELQSLMFTETGLECCGWRNFLGTPLDTRMHQRFTFGSYTSATTRPLDPSDFSPRQFPSAGPLCTDMLHLVNNSCGESARASCHVHQLWDSYAAQQHRPILSGCLPTPMLLRLGLPTLLHELFTRNSSLQTLSPKIMNK